MGTGQDKQMHSARKARVPDRIAFSHGWYTTEAPEHTFIVNSALFMYKSLGEKLSILLTLRQLELSALYYCIVVNQFIETLCKFSHFNSRNSNVE